MKPETPPPPPPQRVILADDAADMHVEAAAESQRREAFQAANHWQSMPLAWSSSRASLYMWLRLPAPRLSEQALAAFRAARDEPGNGELQQQADDLFAAETAGDQSHFRNAQIILYLAAHNSKTWRSFAHDKSRFLEEIELWVDAHVAPDQIFELAEVTNKLLADADSTRAMVRPSHRGTDEEGN